MVLLVTLYSVGAAGYAVLEDVPPFDASYMTAITLGIAVFWIAFTSLVSAFVSSHVRNMMRSRKLQSEIDQAKKRVILCGYGRMGALTVADLRGGQAPVVVELIEFAGKGIELEMDE